MKLKTMNYNTWNNPILATNLPVLCPYPPTATVQFMLGN